MLSCYPFTKRESVRERTCRRAETRETLGETKSRFMGPMVEREKRAESAEREWEGEGGEKGRGRDRKRESGCDNL